MKIAFMCFLKRRWTKMDDKKSLPDEAGVGGERIELPTNGV
jgi:hypothetical protein